MTVSTKVSGKTMQIEGFRQRLKAAYRERHLFALRVVARRLIPNYRLTFHRIDWWHDPQFNAYLDRFKERHRFNTHRRWMVWQLIALIHAVPGDTAECGVFEGAGSWLICAANEGTGRIHHVFDSFEGLSAPGVDDGKYWSEGGFATGEEVVRRNLEPFLDSAVFHKGWIPDRFQEVADRKFAFVHVDVDLRQPTLDSFEFFYPRMSDGGVLLCDDYGCTTCPGATEAIDAFLADKPEKMVALDAGGGFLIKGIAMPKSRSPMPRQAG